MYLLTYINWTLTENWFETDENLHQRNHNHNNNNHNNNQLNYLNPAELLLCRQILLHNKKPNRIRNYNVNATIAFTTFICLALYTETDNWNEFFTLHVRKLHKFIELHKRSSNERL